ncbi:cyclin 2, putative [Bodo saltans]|uniref:Cyclin n=1 Tax=Bodo saltans TaxID=75058 RepID=A0A0S4J0V7_BODSA|nr:cyclin 2, putative [Bodo saltans]|eukprot:CUG78871.1 cyclin 2, putative [Bodo saltans]
MGDIYSDINILLQLTVAALQQRCSDNRDYELTHQTRFHSSRTPQISMWDYMKRIAKYSGCSPECFIISVILIDRYVEATGIPLTFRNVHRLTITAVMLSAKIRDDVYYSNAYYASIGGVSNSELNILELELLVTLRWTTWVEPDEYRHSVDGLFVRFQQQQQQQGGGAPQPLH